MLEHRGAIKGPGAQLRGLKCLRRTNEPKAASVVLTVGLPDLARRSGKLYYEIQLLSRSVHLRAGWLSDKFKTCDEQGGLPETYVGDDSDGWAFADLRHWHAGQYKVSESVSERRFTSTRLCLHSVFSQCGIPPLLLPSSHSGCAAGTMAPWRCAGPCCRFQSR